jgi:hypothetical protein
VGAAPTNNPFIVAGVDAAGNTRRGQVYDGANHDPLIVQIGDGTTLLLTATEGAAKPAVGLMAYGEDAGGLAETIPVDTGATFRYVLNRITDGALVLTLAEEDEAAPTTGIMAGGIYRAVKQALEDGDAGLLQMDAFGNLEVAGYNRALGSLQVVEQSPVAYDTLVPELRASAALPAAGAWDAAPTEVPTGTREFLLLTHIYTRGAAGGSFRHMVEVCTTFGGVDYWGQAKLIQRGAFALGGTVNSSQAIEDFLYGSQGAAAEGSYDLYELGRGHKVRVTDQEVGAVGNPGTLHQIGILFNR